MTTSMTTPTSPADVVKAVAEGVSRLTTAGPGTDEREELIDRLAAMYGEATDVRHPFAPLGDTPLLSRAALREHFAAPRPPAEAWAPVGMHVHETADPEVVIAEFRYEGTLDGRRFSFPCIFVTRVRDGVIIESRDYIDHLASARAVGRLDGVLAALSGE